MPLTVERGWDNLHVNLQDDIQQDAAQERTTYSACCAAPLRNDTSKRCATWNTRSRQSTPSVISTAGADWGDIFTSGDTDCDNA